MEYKIGISTLYTGYNYGSALQAYAVKELLKELHYNPVLFKLRGSIIKGRDVRLKKAMVLASRALLHFDVKSIKKYKILSNTLSETSIKLFNEFYDNVLQPQNVSYRELKKLAKQAEYYAFVCGSDQIWDAFTYYVDPFYYLEYAPVSKRIAFAPSFGYNFIPKYNIKRINKKINGIRYLSVRELSGQILLKEMFQRDATVLLDPTLLISKEDWVNKFDLQPQTKLKKYVLAYFLNEPSNNAKSTLDKFKNEGYSIISLPISRYDWETVSAGPKEFISYLMNAFFVCTDSFHGTVFSIIFEKSFLVFPRGYANNEDQSTRISSLLNLTNFEDRYSSEDMTEISQDRFNCCKKYFGEEKIKAVKYLQSALDSINN